MQAHVAQWLATQVHGGLMQYKHPAYRDTRNCTVRAIADALGLHRITAYEFMKACGRKHGHGTQPSVTRRAYGAIARHHGYECVSLDYFEARADYGRTIVTAQRALQPHERVVFHVRGHVIGFSECVTSDWANQRRHHVVGAYVFKRAA